MQPRVLARNECLTAGVFLDADSHRLTRRGHQLRFLGECEQPSNHRRETGSHFFGNEVGQDHDADVAAELTSRELGLDRFRERGLNGCAEFFDL